MHFVFGFLFIVFQLGCITFQRDWTKHQTLLEGHTLLGSRQLYCTKIDYLTFQHNNVQWRTWHRCYEEWYEI